ncbi:hypothetical protein BN997_00916 [Oceanobacillus oncorhynchi]|uniref:Uncharacterized protein n=1 Tax=Oceanobacillus oncorhynchi TaxID=545501 RepID=A0A0A1M720_9BACI|nr:hypothetical protein BN997_00916 [Oceanobacillus oncorhynchi]
MFIDIQLITYGYFNIKVFKNADSYEKVFLTNIATSTVLST